VEGSGLLSEDKKEPGAGHTKQLAERDARKDEGFQQQK